MVSGKRGTPTTVEAAVPCSALDPVSPELMEQFGLESHIHTKQAFAYGVYDIQLGDILSLDGVDMPIRACAQWEDYSGRFLYHLIVEVQAK